MTVEHIMKLADAYAEYLGNTYYWNDQQEARAALLAAVEELAKYAELGRIAMRFVDRAGDVHPGIDDADRICSEFYNAMDAAINAAPAAEEAPQQPATHGAPVAWQNPLHPMQVSGRAIPNWTPLYLEPQPTPAHIKAMQQALEALEDIFGKNKVDVGAINALRTALAEQPAEQEPVATLWQHGETGRTRITMPDDITDCDARWFKAADLYTAPPQREPLTDEEIEQAYREIWRNVPSGFTYTNAEWIEQGIKYAERAHGIGDQK